MTEKKIADAQVGLWGSIAELEAELRAAGRDPKAICESAGIVYEATHFNEGLVKQRALSFALGLAQGTGSPNCAPATAKLKNPPPSALTKRQEYEALLARDYVAAGKFFQLHSDAILTNAPASTKTVTTENPIAELDRYATLLEAGNAAEAKNFLRENRAAVVEQREGCLQVIQAQVDQERDNNKKYELIKVFQKIRSLPV